MIKGKTGLREGLQGRGSGINRGYREEGRCSLVNESQNKYISNSLAKVQ